MTVEVFPAGVGDSILIRCASEGRSTNILVDGGVRATYEKHLAKRLGELRAEGQRLNLLVVTHIDTDHIGGVVKLLKANGPAATPAVIEIDDVWHNGYRHLGLRGRKPNDTEKRKVLSQVYGSEEAGLPGDISVKEADTLAKLLGQGTYPWNKAWEGEAVVSGKRCSLDGGVSLTVLSPGPDNLRSLGYQWRKGLQKMGVSYEAVDAPEFDYAFEDALPQLDADTAAPAAKISASTSCEPPDPLLFVEDASFINGSSIALLLEWRGLRCVFLGDSWPSVVAEEWGKLPGGPGPLDLVKVSHHGSSHNSSPDLAKRLSSKRYVFSSDGTKRGHPNLDAALWIADGGQPGASLVFNYPSSTAVRLSMPDAIKRFGHVVIVGSEAEILSITMEAEAAREQPEA